MERFGKNCDRFVRSEFDTRPCLETPLQDAPLDDREDPRCLNASAVTSAATGIERAMAAMNHARAAGDGRELARRDSGERRV